LLIPEKSLGLSLCLKRMSCQFEFGWQWCGWQGIICRCILDFLFNANCGISRKWTEEARYTVCRDTPGRRRNGSPFISIACPVKWNCLFYQVLRGGINWNPRCSVCFPWCE
jgi:hypothetical protein